MHSNTDHTAFSTSGPGEDLYRRRHWQIWPQLLASGLLGDFVVRARSEWRRLWGSLGEELYSCFLNGDRNVRSDMIRRAKQAGAGEVAVQLERWRLEIDGERDS